MEFIELALNNFKRFSGARFQFAPGLTLIWGRNEAGKSTILEAICCALYGRDRGRTVESWAGGNCSVDLTYRTGGKTWRIERRPTEGTARLGTVSDDGLTDISSGKDDVSRLIQEHLGVSSRQVLENSVFVRQMCVSKPGVSELDAIGGEIQRILTGTAHVSADEVRKRLEDKRDAVKGRARPTNPREYDQVSARLTEVAEELANTRHSRDQIRKLDEELTELQERTERDSTRLETLNQLLERHKKWYAISERLEELDRRHAEVFSTCRQIKDTLHELTSVQKELEDSADLVGKDDEIADHLNKIQSHREELESRVAGLESVYVEAQPIASRFKLLPVSVCIGLIVAGFLFGGMVDRRLLLLAVPGILFAVAYVLRSVSGRKTESRQIQDLIQNASNELGQLDGELDSILSYVNCREISHAWARIKTYRSLVARSHELELKLTTLLNGRTSQDWETQESGLAREVSAIRSELESDFPGYAPSTEEAESWRKEYVTLQHQLPQAQARMHEVRGSLDTERRNARDMAALEGEIEFLHMRKQELEFIYRAYEEAISALSLVTQTVSEEYLPTLSERASDCLAWMTSGRYTTVEVKQGWEIDVNSCERTGVCPTSLSVGALDQLHFSLRIACGELLSSNCRLPMILDDPFAAFDRERLTNVLSLLAALSHERQIVLLTHDPFILEWARGMSALGDVDCLIHELPAPQTHDVKDAHLAL